MPPSLRCAVLSLSLVSIACTSASTSGSPDSGPPGGADCVNLVPLRLWTTEPSAVALLYRAETCAGEAVQRVPSAGQSLFDLYELTENGASLSSEAIPSVSLSGGQRVYVSVLLDFSASTQPVKSELLDAARVFAETLVAETSKAFIMLSIFDGRTTPHTVLLPTRDLAAVRATLTALKNAGPGAAILGPSPDTGSTNLYGAFVQGVPALQQRQQQVMELNAGGIVTSGYTVVFTDGADTAERVGRDAAKSAVEAARASDGAMLPNVQTYAVALAGSDFTADARSALKSVVGADRYFLEGALADLSARFTALAQRIADESEATHLLTYCSPARAGERSVELRLKGSSGSGIGFSFPADGFAPGCAEFFETICEGRRCAGFNCGACDDATESCEASTGRCINACIEDNLCSGEMTTTPLGYTLTCGGNGVQQCGGACVDTRSSTTHCGGCNAPCDPAEQCVDGTCQCPGGGEVCGGACRSAASFQDDDANCGRCGNACETLGGQGEQCIAGECQCADGGEVCGGTCRPDSYFVENDMHCGTCGNACTAGRTCDGTACACPAGQQFCDGQCRDAAYFESAANCGMCGNTCPAACAGGECVTPTEVAVGGGHQCFLMGNGTVTCVGANDFGQLGDGTRETRTTPVQVQGLTGAQHVTAGDHHSCAVLMDGTIRCWGERARVGDGTSAEDRLTAVTVTGVTGAVEVDAYDNHTCARLGDGRVQCWGNNAFGQLGDGTVEGGLTPVTVMGLPDATEITVGQFFSCARVAGGRARCWGRNNQRQLGIMGGDLHQPGDPVEAPNAGFDTTHLTAISAGQSHACALTADRRPLCWGANASAQAVNSTANPTPVGWSGYFDLMTAVEAGGAHTCAVEDISERSVACWGSTLLGQNPGRFMVRDVEQLSAQGAFTCALRSGGRVTCWGNGRAPADVTW